MYFGYEGNNGDETDGDGDGDGDKSDELDVWLQLLLRVAASSDTQGVTSKIATLRRDADPENYVSEGSVCV